MNQNKNTLKFIRFFLLEANEEISILIEILKVTKHQFDSCLDLITYYQADKGSQSDTPSVPHRMRESIYVKLSIFSSLVEKTLKQ